MVLYSYGSTYIAEQFFLRLSSRLPSRAASSATDTFSSHRASKAPGGLRLHISYNYTLVTTNMSSHRASKAAGGLRLHISYTESNPNNSNLRSTDMPPNRHPAKIAFTY